MKANRSRIPGLLLAGVMILSLLAGCSHRGETAAGLTSVDQFTTERVGVQTGALYEIDLLERCPDVEIAYFSAQTDMYVALEQDKVDSILIEDISYILKKEKFPWLTLLDGAVLTIPIGIAVSQSETHPQLYDQLEEFVRQNEENGVAEEIDTYWFEEYDPDACVVDKSGITGENGTISIAVENGYEPFSYYGNGELQGCDIDFVYRFCRAYGYEPVFYPVDYDAIPVGLSTGKFDIGMGVIITEERSENVLFVGPYTSLDVFAAVKGTAEGTHSFWDSLVQSFQQTFIKENRWMLFVQGTGTTLLISALSALCGTALGFLLYLLCKNGSKGINRVNDMISWLISGTPTVLLLMILYYLIFVGRADIGGVWVAVVGFSLLFGYRIYDILTTSVSAIGKGQEEGARALGYSSNQAFFHVVLPQAMRIAFPQIKGELISLIKETSIVGYISVADLTRMSDIVRGRTYDAFFPLITSTVIYFLLIWLILLVVKRLEIGMTSRQRRIEQIKKGIQIK